MLCVSLLWKCQECIQNDTIFSIWFNLGNELASEGSVHHFVWLKHALGISRQSIKQKIKCGLVNQHMVFWHSLTSTQRQAEEFISGPNPSAKSKLLSFNRMQSRVVTGLHTGRNSLRRHLYIIRLTDSPMCRCGAEEESSAHILCECEALAPLRHTYLGSFFLEPKDIRGLRSI
jgi:hypothetical protein